MKNSIYAIILIFGTFLFSCEPDENIDTDDPRDEIVDTWNCEENSATYGEQHYLVDISIDPADSAKVILSNFFGLGTWSTTKAILSGRTLNIYSQTVEGHTISGTGSIASNYNTINWTYEVVELKKKASGKGIGETVTAVFTR